MYIIIYTNHLSTLSKPFFCSLLLIRAAAGDEDRGDAEMMVWQLRLLRFLLVGFYPHVYFCFFSALVILLVLLVNDCFEFLLCAA